MCEGHRFTRQANDPLEQHLVLARHPDGHDITALRVLAPISQLVDVIAGAIVVSRKHAVPIDAHLPDDVLEEEKLEKNEANHTQYHRADKRPFRITTDGDDAYDAKPARETGRGGSRFHSTIHKRQKLP